MASLKKKTGRPLKNIDEKQVVELAMINCSLAEMGAVLGCDPKTLTERFSALIEQGREKGKMSLKRKQYQVAMSGNVTMLIWLGKIILGQKDIRIEDLTIRAEPTIIKRLRPDSEGRRQDIILGQAQLTVGDIKDENSS